MRFAARASRRSWCWLAWLPRASGLRVIPQCPRLCRLHAEPSRRPTTCWPMRAVPCSAFEGSRPWPRRIVTPNCGLRRWTRSSVARAAAAGHRHPQMIIQLVPSKPEAIRAIRAMAEKGDADRWPDSLGIAASMLSIRQQALCNTPSPSVSIRWRCARLVRVRSARRQPDRRGCRFLDADENVEHAVASEFWFVADGGPEAGTPLQQFLLTLSVIYPLTMLVPAVLRSLFDRVLRHRTISPSTSSHRPQSLP